MAACPSHTPSMATAAQSRQSVWIAVTLVSWCFVICYSHGHSVFPLPSCFIRAANDAFQKNDEIRQWWLVQSTCILCYFGYFIMVCSCNLDTNFVPESCLKMFNRVHFTTGVIATGARDGNIIIWDKRCKPSFLADTIAPAHHMTSRYTNLICKIAQLP